MAVQREQDHSIFSYFETSIRDLVESHKELEEEKLLFAVYFEPNRKECLRDVFLFEVFDGWHQNTVSAERDFWEVIYGPTEAFPMDRGQQLHLILTNPVELEVGLNENWPLACEIRSAVKQKNYDLIFCDSNYCSLWERLGG